MELWTAWMVTALHLLVCLVGGFFSRPLLAMLSKPHPTSHSTTDSVLFMAMSMLPTVTCMCNLICWASYWHAYGAAGPVAAGVPAVHAVLILLLWLCTRHSPPQKSSSQEVMERVCQRNIDFFVHPVPYESVGSPDASVD